MENIICWWAIPCPPVTFSTLLFFNNIFKNSYSNKNPPFSARGLKLSQIFLLLTRSFHFWHPFCKIETVYEPSGPSLPELITQFLLHDATRSISTSP